MKAGRGPVTAVGWVTLAVLGALAGCSGDIAGELGRNVHVRERVMTAIAADSSLAGEMAQRMLATDAQRRRLIETVLADDRSANYVLARIGRNTTAVDYVLQTAAADSAGRAHLRAVFMGTQTAAKGAKK
jgi:Tfp pilus assembly major pilin PilA